MFPNWTSLARTFALRRQLFGDIITKSVGTTASTTNIFTNWKNYSFNSNASKWTRSNRNYNERFISTSQVKFASHASTPTIVSKEESREFMAMFPDIVRYLTAKNPDIPDVNKWYAKVLQQNVPNGKNTRGFAVIATYKMLEDPNNLTPENIRLANILGWCAEMLDAYLIIIDDIIGGSEIRRGKPSWYKRVGLIAMSDSQLIENSIFALLRGHFSHLPMYLPAVELIHDVTQKTCIGQALDTLSWKNGRPNLEEFTMDKFNSLSKYKSYHFAYRSPIALGMFLANKFEMDSQADTVLVELGQFFQIQNDFWDCFGDPKKTGKIGTDIQEGKCTWLIVVALQRATPSQKKVIEENYGKQDPVAVAVIKKLYRELGLPNAYAIYKEDTYNLIRTHILQITGLPHALFFKLLDELYKAEF